MRIWTVHPRYLDPKGLVALWRETLLARAVLRGETKGYRHHPQLQRFQAQPDPVAAIDTYLAAVLAEAQSRGYSFDPTKIGAARMPAAIPCTGGQLRYEWRHLLEKLRLRSPADFARWQEVSDPQPHPSFRIVAGAVEPWERVS